MLLEKQQLDYPYEDEGMLLFKEEKTLYILLLDEKKKLGLYNLLPKVESVFIDEREIPFVQTHSLEGDPYLGISLPHQGPLLLRVNCQEEIGFLPFGN